MKENKIYYIFLFALFVCFVYIGVTFDGCGEEKETTIDTATTKKVIFNEIKPDTIFEKSPTLTTTIKDTVIPEGWLPKQDYDDLKEQYWLLLESFLSQRTYRDTFNYDSVFVYLLTFISKNEVDSYRAIFSGKIKETIITNNITKETFIKKKMFFVKGEIGSDVIFKTQKASFGFIYKSKKDNLFLIDVEKDTKGNTFFNAGMGIKLF